MYAFQTAWSFNIPTQKGVMTTKCILKSVKSGLLSAVSAEFSLNWPCIKLDWTMTLTVPMDQEEGIKYYEGT